MKIDVGNVTLYFDPECPECHNYNDYVLSGVNIYDITFTGIPICPECGEELTLKSECDVSLN